MPLVVLSASLLLLPSPPLLSSCLRAVFSGFGLFVISGVCAFFLMVIGFWGGAGGEARGGAGVMR
jgi:hypothetical protein